MRFSATSLHDTWLIDPEPVADHRGFFERTFCVHEYRERGLETSFVQHSISYSKQRGTMRGMHYQRAPYEEVKIVTCLKGAVRDVIIDLRLESPTFGRWQGFELTEANRRQLYIPAGFAHGFQTLSDDAEVGYLISQFYAPAAAHGVRHDDPAFGIDWPLPVTVMSVKDKEWPAFAPLVPPPAAALRDRQPQG
jgi:dTDP-4-dehydrorhamnose 3,5-epimerase